MVFFINISRNRLNRGAQGFQALPAAPSLLTGQNKLRVDDQSTPTSKFDLYARTLADLI